jgi:hypothetical protein
MAKNVAWKIGRRWTIIREESLGPAAFTGIDLGESPVLVGDFRTYDADAAQRIFATTMAGGSTGVRGVFYPGTVPYRTGGLISDLGVKLLLTPDDVENQRFLCAYNAVPLTDEDSSVPFQRGDEWVIPFRFVFLPDGSGRVYSYHLRQDLEIILA